MEGRAPTCRHLTDRFVPSPTPLTAIPHSAHPLTNPGADAGDDRGEEGNSDKRGNQAGVVAGVAPSSIRSASMMDGAERAALKNGRRKMMINLQKMHETVGTAKKPSSAGGENATAPPSFLHHSLFLVRYSRSDMPYIHFRTRSNEEGIGGTCPGADRGTPFHYYHYFVSRITGNPSLPAPTMITFVLAELASFSVASTPFHRRS